NLIHASASSADAEREIKLWFKPHDIPTPMHPYETAICEEHYYYFRGNLTKGYCAGAICLLAPGNVAWKSDLEALNLIIHGKDTKVPLNSVIAKYLINEDKEEV
ncbi:MAG: nucleoside-diphosphate kinase, partial [Chitinispirillaceae bacterium]|nr:nucleoside-diphosphate kinase [Chitinispirillaceae bacterium]